MCNSCRGLSNARRLVTRSVYASMSTYNTKRRMVRGPSCNRCQVLGPVQDEVNLATCKLSRSEPWVLVRQRPDSNVTKESIVCRIGRSAELALKLRKGSGAACMQADTCAEPGQRVSKRKAGRHLPAARPPDLSTHDIRYQPVGTRTPCILP